MVCLTFVFVLFTFLERDFCSGFFGVASPLVDRSDGGHSLRISWPKHLMHRPNVYKELIYEELEPMDIQLNFARL